jgi:hypothetical protein
MANHDEALLLWAIPTWQQWAEGESDRDLARWRRILIVDAPLCPFRIGRQPSHDDRIDWHE